MSKSSYEGGQNLKRYTRRQILKGGARIGIYAIIGGMVGKAYESISNLLVHVEKKTAQELHKIDEKYNKVTSELRESQNIAERAAGVTGEGVKNAEGWRARLFRKAINRTDQEVGVYRKKRDIPTEEYSLKDNSKPEEVNLQRRSFLKGLLGFALHHPVTTGTVAGATYGSAKSAIDYHQNPGRKTAKLQDKLAEQDKKIEDLERKTGNSDKNEEFPGEARNYLFLAGITGVIISIILSSINITGLVISSSQQNNLSLTNLFIFIISFILILFAKI